jgi:hypothetical protein
MISHQTETPKSTIKNLNSSISYPIEFYQLKQPGVEPIVN